MKWRGSTIHVAKTKALVRSAPLFSHICKKPVFSRRGSLVGEHSQPDSAKADDGMRHVGFRVFLVLYHYLCYKNDVILYDQSSSYPVVSILRNEFQALSLTKLYGLN